MGQSIIAIMPEVLMTFFAIGLLVIDLVASNEKKSGIAYFGIAFILITLLLTIPVSGFKVVGFEGMLVWDSYAYAFFVVFSIAFILGSLGAVDYMKRLGINKGEYYIILFLSIIGMLFMVSATDLTILYLGMETMALLM